MNLSSCEYSSGCESGWTMYLDQLSNSIDHHNYNHQYQDNKNGEFANQEHDDDDDDDDEDMSMISDASSGPPHFHHNDASASASASADAATSAYSQYYGYYTPSIYEDTNNTNKSNTKETISRSKKHQSLCLDDTASSPIYDFSQDNVAPSHDYSQVVNIPGQKSILVSSNPPQKEKENLFPGKKEAIIKKLPFSCLFCCNCLRDGGLQEQK
ncbi:structural constituent of ribosome [Striga asiatica]|uniref:Structural constituent of ribosome n=1 Tax=Striga asiatica TaxID=4170 RepID=A0A5A7Q6Y8_STRAF|nr:structural constituent of ribosome [Striga asiatica]